MISQKQLDANRRNAQLSTGPRTPEGRAAVRSNALRHGLTAKTAVLDSENPDHFQEMLDAFEAEYQPAGPTEELLVQQIVMSAWRLQRLRAVETATFDMRLRTVGVERQQELGLLTEPERQAYVFQDDARNAHTLDKLSRYEARIERSFYKALRELQHLQSTRPLESAPADAPVLPDAPLPAESATSDEFSDPAKQTHSQFPAGSGQIAASPRPPLAASVLCGAAAPYVLTSTSAPSRI